MAVVGREIGNGPGVNRKASRQCSVGLSGGTVPQREGGKDGGWRGQFYTKQGFITTPFWCRAGFLRGCFMLVDSDLVSSQEGN